MKNSSIIVLGVIIISMIHVASGQSDNDKTELQMELIVTDEPPPIGLVALYPPAQPTGKYGGGGIGFGAGLRSLAPAYGVTKEYTS
mgnify:CR=1 FL=1